MTQSKFTFACDNCGKRQEWQFTGSPDETIRGRAAAGRKVLAFLGWHYVTADKSQDGRFWELCNSQVCPKCKKDKQKTCLHSCQAKWLAVAPIGWQTAPILTPVSDGDF